MKAKHSINSKKMSIPSKPASHQITIEGNKISGGSREQSIPSSPTVIKGGK